MCAGELPGGPFPSVPGSLRTGHRRGPAVRTKRPAQMLIPTFPLPQGLRGERGERGARGEKVRSRLSVERGSRCLGPSALCWFVCAPVCSCVHVCSCPPVQRVYVLECACGECA